MSSVCLETEDITDPNREYYYVKYVVEICPVLLINTRYLLETLVNPTSGCGLDAPISCPSRH